MIRIQIEYFIEYSGYADKIHGLQIPAGCYSFIHI